MTENQEIEITSFDGVRLSGTLSVPPNMKSLFIPVHGSFLQTRDGDLDETATWMFPKGTSKRRLFADMAASVLDLGVGSFRFDKRASGKSGGIYKDTDLVVLAKDLQSILMEMRRRFPHIQIGLVGQSEGALTSLKACDLGARPDFLILQGPALESFSKTMEFQRTHAAAAFLSDKTGELARNFPYISALYQALYQGDMVEKIEKTSETHYLLHSGNWSAETSLSKYRQYFWNGLEFLRALDLPTTLIFAENDLNIRPGLAAEIEAAKAQGQYPHVNLILLKGLEHSFREFRSGDNFVDAMKKPISPLYIATWRDLMAQTSAPYPKP